MKQLPAPQRDPLLASRSYRSLFAGVVELLEQARRASARLVNSVITTVYWEIGHRIVEHEQQGRAKPGYGEQVMERLAADLTARFGRGFSQRNVFHMRQFYLSYRGKLQTLSAKSTSYLLVAGPRRKLQTLSAKSSSRARQRLATTLVPPALADLAPLAFPLSWSHYVCLLSVESLEARAFYEAEAVRGGWSVRQLDRQISSLVYERTLASRGRALLRGAVPKAEAMTPEAEIKEPLVLEFLGLKDEYSESALEEALIHHLEHFLLELGNDFTFVARQKSLRIGNEWYRIDLLFYHRRLRCLVVADLKIGKFTHADAGQMNLYLNYAREHWTQPGENPPVGLILCSRGDEAVAHYALGNLGNKVLAREYRLLLPQKQRLIAAMEKSRKALRLRRERA
ncbi:MAG: DUF1016 domain-containing protein [Acidobacteria bacterium]|nr:DUF1016 domain-containing protein [Acidobacteriota bacterium]